MCIAITLPAREISCKLSDRLLSSLHLIENCYGRVQKDNAQGRSLHDVLNLTRKQITITTAKTRDKDRRSGVLRNPLYGMLVFIKGSMATGPDLNVSTSFEAHAFGNAIADHDAFLVAKVREAGFIVMNKKNPGVLDGFKDQLFSPGWSAPGG